MPTEETPCPQLHRWPTRSQAGQSCLPRGRQPCRGHFFGTAAGGCLNQRNREARRRCRAGGNRVRGRSDGRMDATRYYKRVSLTPCKALAPSLTTYCSPKETLRPMLPCTAERTGGIKRQQHEQRLPPLNKCAGKCNDRALHTPPPTTHHVLLQLLSRLLHSKACKARSTSKEGRQLEACMPKRMQGCTRLPRLAVPRLSYPSPQLQGLKPRDTWAHMTGTHDPPSGTRCAPCCLSGTCLPA